MLVRAAEGRETRPWYFFPGRQGMRPHGNRRIGLLLRPGGQR